MIKNKGFTLVELLAVLIILSLILFIVAPNVLKMIERGKKQRFVADAEEMISLAKYKSKLEKYENLFVPSGDECYVITMNNLGFEKTEDANGYTYDRSNSSVKYCYENNRQVFYITLISSDGNNSMSINNVKEDSLSIGSAN